MNSSGAPTVSNALNLGGVGLLDSLMIPEGNTQGYFSMYSAAAATVNHFYRFYVNGAAYRVTTGKTCKIVRYMAMSQTANEQFQFVHSLTSWADDAAALTSGVYQTGSFTSGVGINLGAAQTYVGFSCNYDFPSLAYTGWHAAAGVSYTIIAIAKEV